METFIVLTDFISPWHSLKKLVKFSLTIFMIFLNRFFKSNNSVQFKTKVKKAKTKTKGIEIITS